MKNENKQKIFQSFVWILNEYYYCEENLAEKFALLNCTFVPNLSFLVQAARKQKRIDIKYEKNVVSPENVLAYYFNLY